MKDLLSIRKEKNLTQKALGNLIGVSDVQVGRIEQRTRELSLRQYSMLCKALKLSNDQAQQLMDEALATAKPPRIRKSKKAQE